MGEIRRIGIYGGTFDPIHIGHLAIAEEAKFFLGLDSVIFVPAARQPLKHHAQGASPSQRLEMARLACEGNSSFAVSDVEVFRLPPSYTIHTLQTLRSQFPHSTELFFILGVDAALELPRWHRPHEVLELVQLAIIGRPGYQADFQQVESVLPEFAAKAHLINGPQLDISSSELRRRMANQQPVRYQIPQTVLQYIDAQGLYRSLK